MKNTIKNTAYALTWVGLLTLNNATNAAMNMSGEQINQNLVGDNRTADVVIQDWISTITMYLAIIAIIVILWAWFQILTASWDEEKVKKWKSIIVQVVIWMLVIFIAWSIVWWVISKLFVAG